MTHHFHVSVFGVLFVLFSYMVIKPAWLIASIFLTQKGIPIGASMSLI